MEKLIEKLEFLEDYSLEKEAYFSTPHLYDPLLEFEIQFLKKQKSSHQHHHPGWYLRVKGDEGDWRKLTKEQLLQHLGQESADLEQFAAEVVQHILTQTWFAQLYLDSATQLLGSSMVEAALQGMLDFKGQLNAVLDQVFKKQKKFTVVKNNEEEG